MGFLTKPCDADEVFTFIDAFQRGDDARADPIGERIFKTKNKSSGAVIEALLTIADIFARAGRQVSVEEADRFLSGTSGDRPAVVAAKRELLLAFFGSPDPAAAVNATMSRQAQDPQLTNVDRIDDLLSLMFSAAHIANAYGITMRFSAEPGSPVPAPPPETETSPVVPSHHPADWYPDPHGVARLRYWDGTRWTEHTA